MIHTRFFLEVYFAIGLFFVGCFWWDNYSNEDTERSTGRDLFIQIVLLLIFWGPLAIYILGPILWRRINREFVIRFFWNWYVGDRSVYKEFTRAELEFIRLEASKMSKWRPRYWLVKWALQFISTVEKYEGKAS